MMKPASNTVDLLGIFAGIAWLVAILLLLIGVFMSGTVEVPGTYGTERVANLAAISNKMAFLLISGFFAVVGTIALVGKMIALRLEQLLPAPAKNDSAAAPAE